MCAFTMASAREGSESWVFVEVSWACMEAILDWRSAIWDCRRSVLRLVDAGGSG